MADTSDEALNPIHATRNLSETISNDSTYQNTTTQDNTDLTLKQVPSVSQFLNDDDDEDGGHHDPHGHGGSAAPTKVPAWIVDLIDPVFKIKRRKTTIELEVFTGVVQFISCLYVLPVIPSQLKRAGYDETASIIATALTCSLGSIAASFLTDMPLIVAPPTSVSIFLAVSMQQSAMPKDDGNTAVMISGIILTCIGILPPVGRFLTRLIPDCLQASTSVGIGMITALAGATELGLVVRGKYTIVDMGEITAEVVIGIAAMIIVAVMLHFHVKGAFATGLIFGTIVWWLVSGEYPVGLVADPSAAEKSEGRWEESQYSWLLIMNLVFLYVLTLNGLARAMSDLAGLTKKNGAIPRAGLLFMTCGLTTILSGYFSGPPVLISPESAAGIKAGAKTGLSTLVCGILFGISVFFYPVFAAVPAAGTAPLLIIVGVVLFNNVKRVDWSDMKVAVPAYVTLFFIPFTYSILRGVAFGYVIYVFIGLFTGEMIQHTIDFYHYYAVRAPKALRLPLATSEASAEAIAAAQPHPDTDQDPDDGRDSNTAVGKLLKFIDKSMELDSTGIAVNH